MFLKYTQIFYFLHFFSFFSVTIISFLLYAPLPGSFDTRPNRLPAFTFAQTKTVIMKEKTIFYRILFTTENRWKNLFCHAEFISASDLLPKNRFQNAFGITVFGLFQQLFTIEPRFTTDNRQKKTFYIFFKTYIRACRRRTPSLLQKTNGKTLFCHAEFIRFRRLSTAFVMLKIHKK